MTYSTEQILKETKAKISQLLPLIEEDPINQSPSAITMLRAAYAQLRTAFLKQPLSKADEIDFFKYRKPKLSSHLIYCNELYKMESHQPMAGPKTIRKYYKRQLKKSEQFFAEHAQFYNYYRKGHQYLDAVYFLRHQQDCHLALESFCFELDPLFATAQDYKVAQLMAHKKLQAYLLSKIQSVSNSKPGQQQKRLKWTGSKVGLVELIYALHTQGVFNHGGCDIREVVLGFSQAFDIDLGQFHRTFYEITARKSDRTKFLNKLQEQLIRRMDQVDAYKRPS